MASLYSQNDALFMKEQGLQIITTTKIRLLYSLVVENESF